MKFYIIIFLCMFGATEVKSQTYFSLTPMLGLQRCFSKYLNGNSPETFDSNILYRKLQYGLLIDYHKSKCTFSTGIINGYTGTWYRISFPLNNPNNPSTLVTGSVYSSYQIISIPIRASYSLKEFYLFKIKRDYTLRGEENEKLKNIYYLTSFKFKVFTGVLFDHLTSMQNQKSSGGDIGYTVESFSSPINRNGVTATFGFTLQFIQRNKERLAVNFYYNQGITKYMVTNQTYTVGNNSYYANVVARGTSFGILLSYPIKIWDVDKRRSIKTSGN